MSGPGNLDKSPARTMQEMREVVHDLVVNQLGVMGPETVQSLALEAPAGLEEYPRDITLALGKTVRLFDDS